MTTPKFNIEDCSESEQDETQKKSSEIQPLFQTSLFSSLTTNSKQLKKKPLVKLTLQDFLTNYDHNFDDVFGEQELPQTKQQISKKKQKKAIQKKKPISDSESVYKSISKISKKKLSVDSEQSNEKHIEPTIVKQQKQKNQKKHRLIKINSSKLTSEEKQNDVKRYDPNSIDLPENTKTDKKNYKLRKFLFSFGLEQQNPEDEQEQEEQKDQQVEEQIQCNKQLNNKNAKMKNNITNENNDNNNNNDNQIEQMDIDKIENNNTKKRNQTQKQQENEKQKEQKQSDVEKTILNLDTLKLNEYIPECNPKNNDDNINQ